MSGIIFTIVWAKYAFEFLSIFIAVIAAFALSRWGERRNDRKAERKILEEISNGLKKDMADVKENKGGHEGGLKACIYWKNVINGQEVDTTQVGQQYFLLLRDFISIQNVSGYESLKSKGLEIIQNDSIRQDIIELYEHDFDTLRKLEEEYAELQFHAYYFKDINKLLADHFVYNDEIGLVDIELPLSLSSTDKNLFMSYLWKIRLNRQFILANYIELEKKINALNTKIEQEIK